MNGLPLADDVPNTPDLDRADVALVLAGTWELAIPDQQRAVADLAMAAAAELVLPLPGLLTHGCLLGMDGVTLLHYQQWNDKDAAREFLAAGRYGWYNAVDAVVPGIVRRPAREYQVYRGRRFGARGGAGCVVVVERLFDRPDRERARRWIDSMFELPERDRPMPGAISAHFHLGSDGSSVQPRPVDQRAGASPDLLRHGREPRRGARGPTGLAGRGVRARPGAHLHPSLPPVPAGHGWCFRLS